MCSIRCFSFDKELLNHLKHFLLQSVPNKLLLIVFVSMGHQLHQQLNWVFKIYLHFRFQQFRSMYKPNDRLGHISRASARITKHKHQIKFNHKLGNMFIIQSHSHLIEIFIENTIYAFVFWLNPKRKCNFCFIFDWFYFTMCHSFCRCWPKFIANRLLDWLYCNPFDLFCAVSSFTSNVLGRKVLAILVLLHFTRRFNPNNTM